MDDLFPFFDDINDLDSTLFPFSEPDLSFRTALVEAFNTIDQRVWKYEQSPGSGGPELTLASDPNQPELWGQVSNLPESTLSALQESDQPRLYLVPAGMATALAYHLAAEECRSVCLFSHTPRVELAEQILAFESRVSPDRLGQGRLQPKEIARLIDAADALLRLPLVIDDRTHSFLETADEILKFTGVELFVIDDVVEMGSDAELYLNALAKTVGLPIVAKMQTSKAQSAAGLDLKGGRFSKSPAPGIADQEISADDLVLPTHIVECKTPPVKIR